MSKRKTNILTSSYEEISASPRDPETTSRQLDLSGVQLGARIEELGPGATSSYHHYHTAEEEHVLVLSGVATLRLGDEALELVEGDHIWFPAGEEVAHHLKNTSTELLKYLVFGERKRDDVVFYPKGSVMLVKSSTGYHQYDYSPRVKSDTD